MDRQMATGEKYWSQGVSFSVYSEINESTQRKAAESNTYLKWRAIT